MRRPALVLGCLCALYLGVTIYRADLRPLWYDELFTFYLAQMPLDRFMGAMRAGLDLNPPLIYAATWASQSILGAGHIATRLPAILGFLLLMLALYKFAERRLPAPFALIAPATVMVTGAYGYSMEARSYGLVLGFSGLALACWQRAAEPRRKHRYLAGMALSVLAAMLTHCYALLLVAALGLGELARARRERRFDLGIWLAGLIAPSSAILLYIPLLGSSRKVQLAGPIFDPTLIRMIASYGDLIVPALPAIVPCVLALAVAAKPRRQPLPPDPDGALKTGFAVHEWAALAGFALAPVLAFILAGVTGGGYFTRYGLGAAISLSAAWAAVCHRFWRATPAAAGFLPLLGCAWFLFTFAGDIVSAREIQGNTGLPAWPAIEEWKQRPNEPLVIADGQTFLELDHYLDDSTASRLVFLLDRDSALRYMKTDCYDAAMRVARPWFPFRGRIVDFDEFRGAHPEFLLYGKPPGDHEWIVDRLAGEKVPYAIVSTSAGGGRQLLRAGGPATLRSASR